MIVTRRGGLKTVLTNALPFLDLQVLQTLRADDNASEHIGPLSPLLQECFAQPLEAREAQLVRLLQEENPEVLAMFDSYAHFLQQAQEETYSLLCYPFHGGVVPWRAVRAALHELQKRDEPVQETLLERAVALLLWSLADALVDCAVDQQGWYDVHGDFSTLPEPMKDYTPDWLRGTDRRAVLFTEMRAFPLSERLQMFLDGLAVAGGQVSFAQEFCREWCNVRTALKRVPARRESTFRTTEVFELGTHELAEALNAQCASCDLPPYFAESLQHTPVNRPQDAPLFVDTLDLVLLGAVVGPSLQAWLEEHAELLIAVRVCCQSAEQAAWSAEQFRGYHFDVCPFPDKLLVRYPLPKQKNRAELETPQGENA